MIIRAVGDEVETDQFLDVVGLASHFGGEFVDVEAHLVKVRSGFRHGGDEDQRDAERHAPGFAVGEGGEGELGQFKPGGVGDVVKVNQPKGDGDEVAENRAEQNRQHPDQSLALQIDREQDGRDHGDESHCPGGCRHFGGSPVASVAKSGIRQRNTDDHRHRPCDDRRQDAIQRCFAHAHDQHADQDFKHGGQEDAHLDDLNAFRAIGLQLGR